MCSAGCRRRYVKARRDCRRAGTRDRRDRPTCGRDVRTLGFGHSRVGAAKSHSNAGGVGVAAKSHCNLAGGTTSTPGLCARTSRAATAALQVCSSDPFSVPLWRHIRLRRLGSSPNRQREGGLENPPHTSYGFAVCRFAQCRFARAATVGVPAPCARVMTTSAEVGSGRLVRSYLAADHASARRAVVRTRRPHPSYVLLAAWPADVARGLGQWIERARGECVLASLPAGAVSREMHLHGVVAGIEACGALE